MSTPTTTPKQEAMNYLGRGIYIFDMTEASKPDQERSITVSEGTIAEVPLRETGITTTKGSNFAEFKHKLAVESGLKGSYQGFSASIKSKFSTESTQSTKTQFMRMGNTISGSTLNISNDRKVLQGLLTDSFKSSLTRDTATDIFKQHGTHVVTRAVIGGSAFVDCHSVETKSLTERQFQISVEAKFKALGGSLKKLGAGGEASSSVTNEERQLLENVVSDTSLRVFGGGASQAQALIENKPGSWEEWAKSVANLPVLMSYPKGFGLIPIWELVGDATKRSELELAYKKLAVENVMIEVFSRTCEISSRPDEQVVVPQEYKMLSGGALVNRADQGVLLTASFPEKDNTWRALAKDHAIADSATMTVYAIALYDPDDLWEVKITRNTGAAEGHPHAEVNVSDGYVMVGGGAKVNWTGSGNLLTASYPQDTETWWANARDHKEEDPSSITVYCLGVKVSMV